MILEFIDKIIAYVYIVIFFALCFIGIIISIAEVIKEEIIGNKNNNSRR